MKGIHVFLIALVLVAVGVFLYWKKKKKGCGCGCGGGCGSNTLKPEATEVTMIDPETGQEYIISALGENQLKPTDQMNMKSRAHNLLMDCNCDPNAKVVLKLYKGAAVNEENLIGTKEVLASDLILS